MEAWLLKKKKIVKNVINWNNCLFSLEILKLSLENLKAGIFYFSTFFYQNLLNLAKNIDSLLIFL